MRRGARAAAAAGAAPLEAGGGWRARARPVPGGGRYPAGDFCSRCGLCDTYYVAQVGEACAFLGPGMARAEALEERVHGRGRDAASDERHFGVFQERFAAAMAPPVDGAQWTGTVTSVAIAALESGLVEAVVCVQSHPDDPLRPMPAIARTREEVLASRGVKPSLSPSLEVLAEVEAQGIRRLLFIGVGCQVIALRSVEHHLRAAGLEELYVMGTFCADNGHAEGLQKFLRETSCDPATVTGYEFMQDYRVHLKHSTGQYEKIPYFCLDANTLSEGVIAPSCASCFDYVNSLADLVVGYMAVPYMQVPMTAHPTIVHVRNRRGVELLEPVRGRMVETPLEDSGDRKPFVLETLLSDDRAALGRVQAPAPLPVGEALATVLEKVGPKGLEFARYSIDYHSLRSALKVKRGFSAKHAGQHIPSYAAATFAEYDKGGALSERTQWSSWAEEEAAQVAKRRRRLDAALAALSSARGLRRFALPLLTVAALLGAVAFGAANYTG